MKTIITNLSEQHFLNRLNSLCTKNKRFDKGYTEVDVFVVKRKQQRFRIGRHLADMPFSRFDGYLSQFIFGEYVVNSLGKVELKYRFGIPLAFSIPYMLTGIVGFSLLAPLLYDAVFNNCYQWGGLFVSSIFSLFGLCGLLVRPKKDRAILEEHLYRICFPKK